MDNRKFTPDSPEMTQATNERVIHLRELGWFCPLHVDDPSDVPQILKDAHRVDSFKIDNQIFTESKEYTEFTESEKNKEAPSEEILSIKKVLLHLDGEISDTTLPVETRENLRTQYNILKEKLNTLEEAPGAGEMRAFKLFVKRTLFKKNEQEDLSPTEENLFNALVTFWNQTIFGSFIKTAMQMSAKGFLKGKDYKDNSLSSIKGTSSATIKYENGEIYVDATLDNLEYVYQYNNKDPNKANEEGSMPLAGQVSSRFVLIPGGEEGKRGMKLVSFETNNALLKDLLLENSVDVRDRLKQQAKNNNRQKRWNKTGRIIGMALGGLVVGVAVGVAIAFTGGIALLGIVGAVALTATGVIGGGLVGGKIGEEIGAKIGPTPAAGVTIKRRGSVRDIFSGLLHESSSHESDHSDPNLKNLSPGPKKDPEPVPGSNPQGQDEPSLADPQARPRSNTRQLSDLFPQGQEGGRNRLSGSGIREGRTRKRE